MCGTPSGLHTESDFILFHAVRYPTDPLLQHHRFGCKGGMDANAQFFLRKEAPVFNIINEERSAKLSRASALTLRELISDGNFESDDMTLMRKPVFLFGDSIDADESPLIFGKYRWLRKIGDIFLFLPIMLRMVPLS